MTGGSLPPGGNELTVPVGVTRTDLIWVHNPRLFGDPSGSPACSSMALLAAQPAVKSPHQQFPCQGDGSADVRATPRHSRVDDVSLDISRQQPARQPESIASSLVGDGDAFDLMPELASIVAPSAQARPRRIDCYVRNRTDWPIRSRFGWHEIRHLTDVRYRSDCRRGRFDHHARLRLGQMDRQPRPARLQHQVRQHTLHRRALDTNARSEGATAKAGVGRMSALGENRTRRWRE
jgi:hypothetical protein